ncbi:Pseudouridine-5'-monophosphatase [Trichostrongylus colubriformis]|uniref:Pseudouridine-5'-monophosphatase n=1 Tax=Trichostrongylus colubriformis TaxID=6319 RepID=A0AAN8G1X6_TRICO
MPVTHVIFDFDGLLVDTEACYTIANQTMLRKFGREYTKELNAKMMGRKEDEAFTWLLKEVGIDDKITVKEYLAQYDVMLEGMFLKCKALPGAERLMFRWQFVLALEAQLLLRDVNLTRIGWI